MESGQIWESVLSLRNVSGVRQLVVAISPAVLVFNSKLAHVKMDMTGMEMLALKMIICVRLQTN